MSDCSLFVRYKVFPTGKLEVEDHFTFDDAAAAIDAYEHWIQSELAQACRVVDLETNMIIRRWIRPTQTRLTHEPPAKPHKKMPVLR
jgi:hypothetical protein